MHSSRKHTARSSSHVVGLHPPGPGTAPGPGLSPPQTEFLTHTCENITLPQTSFAGGDSGFLPQTQGLAAPVWENLDPPLIGPHCQEPTLFLEIIEKSILVIDEKSNAML